jgi:hypothetical protein
MMTEKGILSKLNPEYYPCAGLYHSQEIRLKDNKYYRNGRLNRLHNEIGDVRIKKYLENVSSSTSVLYHDCKILHTFQ